MVCLQFQRLPLTKMCSQVSLLWFVLSFRTETSCWVSGTEVIELHETNRTITHDFGKTCWKATLGGRVRLESFWGFWRLLHPMRCLFSLPSVGNILWCVFVVFFCPSQHSLCWGQESRVAPGPHVPTSFHRAQHYLSSLTALVHLLGGAAFLDVKREPGGHWVCEVLSVSPQTARFPQDLPRTGPQCRLEMRLTRPPSLGCAAGRRGPLPRRSSRCTAQSGRNDSRRSGGGCRGRVPPRTVRGYR